MIGLKTICAKSPSSSSSLANKVTATVPYIIESGGSIQRKGELEKEERKRKIEEERKRRERQAKLEQAGVDHLLGQATAMHRAEQIRAYVAAICEANKTAPDPPELRCRRHGLPRKRSN